MITIIAATNRKGSYTLKVAQHYLDVLKSKTDETVALLDLVSLPQEWVHEAMYHHEGQSPIIRAIQEQYLIPADKFVFIIPEYNGSIPGILKLFIDACSVYRMKDTFKRGDKKALLTGVSSGRAGNLRGMVHFTGMLNYLDIAVLPNQLPISVVDTIMNTEGNINHSDTLKVIDAQIDAFLKF